MWWEILSLIFVSRSFLGKGTIEVYDIQAREMKKWVYQDRLFLAAFIRLGLACVKSMDLL